MKLSKSLVSKLRTTLDGKEIYNLMGWKWIDELTVDFVLIDYRIKIRSVLILIRPFT